MDTTAALFSRFSQVIATDIKKTRPVAINQSFQDHYDKKLNKR